MIGVEMVRARSEGRGPSSDPLLRRLGREEPLRPPEQAARSPRHRRRRRGRDVHRAAGRPASARWRRRCRKPAITAPRQAAEAADDRGDEGDSMIETPIWMSSRAGLASRGSRPMAAASMPRDREGEHDDPVGPDAQHAGHGEVFGRRPHLEAEAGAPQEQPSGRSGWRW